MENWKWEVNQTSHSSSEGQPQLSKKLGERDDLLKNRINPLEGRMDSVEKIMSEMKETVSFERDCREANTLNLQQMVETEEWKRGEC